jgi:hypothetical protein
MLNMYNQLKMWLRISLLFASAIATQAQTTQTPTIQWQRLIGSTSNSTIYQGRVARAGTGGFAAVYRSVIRLDESGAILWDRPIPPSPEYPGYSNWPAFIAAAPDGGFGILGYNQFKWFLARLDADGSVRWLKSFADNPASNALERLTFTGVIYSSDNGFLATAYSSYPRQGTNTRLYKFDDQGNNTIQAGLAVDNLNQSQPVTRANRVVQTKDGNYLLVGGSSDPALNYTSTAIGFVAKLDPQLKAIWKKYPAGRELDDVIISPYDNSAAIAVGSVTGTETRSLAISANGDITEGITLANRTSLTKSFLVAGANPTSHTIVDIVNERQGDFRLQTVVGQAQTWLQRVGGSAVETVTGIVAEADGIGTTTSTDGDVQGKTDTDAAVWLVKVGPLSNNVYSVKSGNWNDPNVWSCTCVPAAYHNVTINDPHVVLLDSTMPLAACLNLEVIGTFSMQGSAILINGVQIAVDTENIVTN